MATSNSWALVVLSCLAACLVSCASPCSRACAVKTETDCRDKLSEANSLMAECTDACELRVSGLSSGCTSCVLEQTSGPDCRVIRAGYQLSYKVGSTGDTACQGVCAAR